MEQTNHTTKSESANQAETALELEYPADNGLYRVIFEEFLPEIADALVRSRAVRMLVELECNFRLIQEELSSGDMGDNEYVQKLEATRQDVVALLWEVCDRLAAEYRRKHGYEPEGEWRKANKALD